jgi:hypothetical protein
VVCRGTLELQEQRPSPLLLGRVSGFSTYLRGDFARSLSTVIGAKAENESCAECKTITSHASCFMLLGISESKGSQSWPSITAVLGALDEH